MSPSSLIFLLIIGFSTNVLADSEHVLVLTEENFEQILTGNEFVFVKFYAPWCGHCKALAPKFDEVADILNSEGSNIRLAKVDATESKELAEKFNVRGYPTLLFFKNGQHVNYNGGRETQQMINWLKKKTGPSVIVIENVAQLKELKEKDHIVVGYFETDSLASNIFKQASELLDDFTFATTLSDEVLQEISLNEEGIALVKNGNDEIVKLPESKINNVEKLQIWIETYQWSDVTEFTPETAQKVVSGKIKQFHFLLAPKTHENFEKILAEFTEAAKLFRTQIIFLLLDIDNSENARILEYLGVRLEDTPTSRIVELSDDLKKYRPEKEDNYETFTRKYLEGEAILDLKAQPLPEDWDAKPVKVLVSENFDQVVNDESKFVFVKFYAPWCGHCKNLAPIWEELAQKYESNPNVVIAKLDSTENELKEVSIQSFPTLKLWPAGSKKVVDYSGERQLDSLVEFIEKHLAGNDEKAEDKAEAETTHAEL